MIETIEAALTPLERVLFQRDAIRVASELREVEGDAIASGIARRYTGELRRALEEVECCMALLRRSRDERNALEARFAALGESLAATESPAERKSLMLEFLALITPRERLAGDAAAFGRWMDLDAVTERYQREIERKYMREDLLVRALGVLMPRVLVAIEREARAEGAPELGDTGATRAVARPGAGERARALLRELEIEPFLLAQVRDARRWQNRVSAFRAIGKLAGALPAAERARILSIETSNFLVRCCLDQDENVWIQRGALELLCELSPREGRRVLERRLLATDPMRRDDFWVRGFAVALLPRVASESHWIETVRRLLRRPEPSEYVRLQVVRTLAAARGAEAERCLLEMARGEGARRDPSPRVRAEIAAEWRRKANRDPTREEVAARLLALLIRRDEAFLVRRVALEEAEALAAARQRRARKYKVDRIDHILLDAMDEVARSDPDIALRRLAEEAREAIVVRNLPAFDWVEGRIAAPLAELDEHSELRVPRRDFAVPEDLLGRILAYFTRDDFGLVVERRRDEYVIRKGDRIRMRLWRVLHELRNPDTAKRQAFRHTTGRVFRGELRIHSGILAELIETKVPGERLWHESEMSWRRFLPLVDDYLSLFSWLPWRRQRTAKIYSSQGVTEIRDTNGFWRGLLRYLKMSWNYARLAGQRNAHERNKVFSDRSRFVRIMREEYGIETRFRPAEYQFEGRTYQLDDPSLEAHFRYGAPRPAQPASAQAPAAVEGDSTPLAAPDNPEETPVVAVGFEGEKAAQGALDSTPAAKDAVESIDSLLRPLEALARGEAAWLEGGEAAEAGLAAAAASGSTDLTGSGSRSALASATPAAFEDTHDELIGPFPDAGPPAAPRTVSDETLVEIPSGAAGGAAPPASAAAPAPLASEPTAAEPPPAGDSTATEAPTAGESTANEPPPAGESTATEAPLAGEETLEELVPGPPADPGETGKEEAPR